MRECISTEECGREKGSECVFVPRKAGGARGVREILYRGRCPTASPRPPTSPATPQWLPGKGGKGGGGGGRGGVRRAGTREGQAGLANAAHAGEGRAAFHHGKEEREQDALRLPLLDAFPPTRKRGEAGRE